VTIESENIDWQYISHLFSNKRKIEEIVLEIVV